MLSAECRNSPPSATASSHIGTTLTWPATPTLSALVAHKYAPVIASGSSERAIKLWDLEGNNIASIRYYNSFLGQRIGAVRSLAFHPNSLLLAAGSNDSIATVYSGEMGGAGSGSHRR